MVVVPDVSVLKLFVVHLSFFLHNLRQRVNRREQHTYIEHTVWYHITGCAMQYSTVCPFLIDDRYTVSEK